MAKGKEFPLYVVMRAVDKATAPLRALGHTAANTVKPFQKLRELNNRMRLAAEAGGLGKITNAARNLGGAVAIAAKKTLMLGTAMASIVMIGGGFLFKITKQTSEYGDKIWKTSQKIGIGVGAWQEFAHAGEMSGIEQDALSTGLVRLNKNIVEAANGNKTMTAWFKRAGISIKDAEGKVKSADQVLMDMAEIFGKMPDGAKKTAVAVALAGRSGADLIPMLNSGSKGLAEMRKEAQDLGLVLSDDTARASETFNDNIERMMKAIRGIVFYIGGLLIPVFDDIVVSVREWVEANRDVIKSKLKEWVEDLQEALLKLKKHFEDAADRISEFISKVAALLALVGGFEGLFKGLAIYIGVSFVSSIATAATAFIALGTAIMTTPVGWILMAITGIAAGAILIYKNWDKIWPVLKKVGHWIMSPLRWFGKLTEWLTSFDLFDIGSKIFTSLWDGMMSIAQGLIAKISSWWSAIKEFFSSISLFDIGSKIFTSLWDGMMSIAQGLIAKISSWWSAIKEFFSSISLFDIGSKIFTSLWDGMMSIAQGLIAKISSWWSAIKEFFSSISLFDIGSKIFTSLWDGMMSIAQGLIAKISSWWSAIKEFFSSISLFDIGSKIFTSLWDGMKSVFGKIKEWFSGIKKIIPDFLLPGNNVTINPPSGQGKEARVTPAAGVIQKNQTITQKSAAEVKVEFANAPKGTTVKTQKNNGVDMDLNMGYAMATH